MGILVNIGTSITPSTVAQWYKVTVPYTSAQAASLTKQVTLYTLPAKSVVHGAYAVATQGFSGGAIVTCTASLGTAASPLKYGLAASVLTLNLTVPGLTLALAPESMSAATAVVAQFTSTVGLLSALTQGALDAYLYISSLE